MKWSLAILAGLIGSISGGFILYFMMAPIYLWYAWLNPVDPSTECSRGGGIAWLSILIGMLLGMVFGVKAVLQDHQGETERSAP